MNPVLEGLEEDMEDRIRQVSALGIQHTIVLFDHV